MSGGGGQSGGFIGDIMPGNTEGGMGGMHQGMLRSLGKSTEVPKEFQGMLDAQTFASQFANQQGVEAKRHFDPNQFINPDVTRAQIAIRDAGQTGLGMAGLGQGVGAFSQGLGSLSEGMETGWVDPNQVSKYGAQLGNIMDYNYQTNALPSILEGAAATGDLRSSNTAANMANAYGQMYNEGVAAPTANYGAQMGALGSTQRMGATQMAQNLPQILNQIFNTPVDAARTQTQNFMGFPMQGSGASGGVGGIPAVQGPGPVALPAMMSMIQTMSSGKGKTAGQNVGQVASMGAGLCHIAEVVYGVEDPRVEICRHMIHTKLVHGQDFSDMYNRVAKTIAPHISPEMRETITPFFDAIVKEAIRG